MIRRVLAVATAVVLPLAAMDATAEFPAVADSVSEGLKELLLERDDAGRARVDDATMAYLEGLPRQGIEGLEDAVSEEWITSSDHLLQILSLRLDASKLELALRDNCFLCHSDPESHGEDTLLRSGAGDDETRGHMRLDHYAADVHFRRGLGCGGCHGGDSAEMMDHDFPSEWPESSAERREDRTWIPQFCARCHSDAAYMRGFNPELATDQLEKYRTSRHGQLLLEHKDSRVAQCVSCHGVHGIQGSRSPLSMVSPKRVPETCASCHSDGALMAGFELEDGSPMPTDQFASYKSSVHGRALLERGDLGAPACNDCHGNHAAMPPEVASVAQICRTCHLRNGTLFDGSRHKAAFEKNNWPECETCHGNHAIARTDDAMLAPGTGSMCESCHDEHARENPECNATAAYFHAELTGLSASYEHYAEETEHVARRGLDTEALQVELTNLFDSLKLARSYIHAFERSEFAQAVAPGHAGIAAVDELLRAGEEEMRFRISGLVIACAFIAATILLLYLKLRSMESGQPPS